MHTKKIKLMRKYIKKFFLISVPTLIILILIFEFVIFRFIIHASETPTLIFDEENKLLRFDENDNVDGVYTIGKFAEIKAKWHVNNFGWNSSIDYNLKKTDKKRICIIGDSYVEAFQVDVNKNISSQIRKALNKDYEVYSFGISGAPFSQYLHISRYVDKYFDPDMLIFILVHNDFDESIAQFQLKPRFLQLKITNDNISEIPPTEPKLRQYLKKSALIRYLYYNINIRTMFYEKNVRNEQEELNANVQVNILKERECEILKVTKFILKTIKKENRDKRILFLMDAPRQDIYEDRLDSSNVIWLNNMVEKVCRENQLEFIDLTDEFSRNYKQNQKRFNSEKDGHWNEYGHFVVSRVLIKYIRENLH